MAGIISYYGGIVKNGLILDLDASKKDSYVSGSATWNDISRNGNNGILTNGPLYNSSNGGNIFFDGSNDTINLGNVLNNNGTQPMSWSLLLNFASSPVFDALIAKYNTGTGYYITMTNTSRVQFGIGQTLTSNAIRVFSSNVLTTSTWYHIVVTYDGSKLASGINIYVNNSNTILTTNYDTFTGSSSNSQSVELGRAGLGGNYFNGNMVQIQIYDRALSAAEVSQNYNALKGRFNL